MISIMDYLKFIKLASNRDKSKENLIEFQNFQAKLIINELKSRNIDLTNSKMLELGCGKGGYSLEFYKYTNQLVISDIYKPELALKHQPNLKFLQFDACKNFPIKSKEFDLVFCSSLIEHISDPLLMIKEIYRILKDDGILILTYPPFYSPVGGHHFKPFHYFGEKFAIKLTNKFRKKKMKSFLKKFFKKGEKITSYRYAYNSYGLYPLKISEVQRLLKRAGFKIKDKWARYSPINVAKIPLLNEVLTWHINFLCKKV